MLNTSPLVSIIIPVYNGSNYLKEAIDSALAQTYKNIEIIVVNDGSNDNDATANIALSYKNQIKYYEKENGGVSSALNLGIAKMGGEFFSWLSHDDVYLPYKIEAQVSMAKEIDTGKIVLFSAFNTIDAKSSFIKSYIIDEEKKYSSFELVLYTMVHGCTMFVPKRAFEEVGLFDETLKTVQDNHMWLRIAKAGYSFLYSKDPLILSRQHDEQGSKTQSITHQEEIKKFYLWASEYVKNEISTNKTLSEKIKKLL